MVIIITTGIVSVGSRVIIVVIIITTGIVSDGSRVIIVVIIIATSIISAGSRVIITACPDVARRQYFRQTPGTVTALCGPPFPSYYIQSWGKSSNQNVDEVR